VSFFDKKISFIDSSRVTAYSSLINFFGFLQGGVGFRGIYLKKYFNIPLKKYFLVTVVQYLLFFIISGILIFAGLSFTQNISTAFKYAVVAIVLSSLLLFLLNKYLNNKLVNIASSIFRDKFIFQSKKILTLVFSIIFMSLGSMLAYGVALSAIEANVTLGGLLLFTGVSQLAILFAVTPGAIGVREGLLLLVQSQMLLSTDDIIVVSTIDRAVYFITLALIVPVALRVRTKKTIGRN